MLEHKSCSSTPKIYDRAWSCPSLGSEEKFKVEGGGRPPVVASIECCVRQWGILEHGIVAVVSVPNPNGKIAALLELF